MAGSEFDADGNDRFKRWAFEWVEIDPGENMETAELARSSIVDSDRIPTIMTKSTNPSDVKLQQQSNRNQTSCCLIAVFVYCYSSLL
jgi:hypothetical protein